MPASIRRLVSLTVAVAAIGLAVPLAAGAATTRYAAPNGTGVAPCVQAEPCSLETALSNAGAEGLKNGDTVLLTPGTYEPAAELDVFRSGVTIEGEEGKPSPVIKVLGERGLFFPNVGTVRDLRIHSTMATTYALALIGPGSVIERVESTGEAFRGCSINATVMRDSVCSATPSLGGGEGIELFIAASSPLLTEAHLTNVTAIGGRVGLFAGANTQSTVVIDAKNTIASGGTAGVIAESDATTAPVTIHLSHSNFAAVETEGVEASVSSPTENGNQTAEPLLVDAADRDYREQPTSPTRLAGDLGAVLPGELDLARNPRTTNCEGTVGVDIGAYQFECPTPETPVVQPQEETKTAPKSESPAGPPTSQPLPTETRPSLSKLALKPAKFTVTGKAPKGTTISFTLSSPASVTLEVLAKQTVKGKKKTVTIGKLPQVTGRTGANSVRFTGKVKGRPLDPGRYSLRVTATTGGLASTPATKTFEVLAAS